MLLQLQKAQACQRKLQHRLQDSFCEEYHKIYRKKLQLDHPAKSENELAKEAKRMEEILARTKATEICAVNTNGTQDQIDSLRGE